MLQKRASGKRTWPNRYDISASGHIELDESPIKAAIREAQEEIGIIVAEADLTLISVQRSSVMAEDGAIENEFQWLYQWLYLYKLPPDSRFSLLESEVAAIKWQTLEDFKSATLTDSHNFVPHGQLYFNTVITSIEAVSP